jgi:hypothetical protein
MLLQLKLLIITDAHEDKEIAAHSSRRDITRGVYEAIGLIAKCPGARLAGAPPPD